MASLLYGAGLHLMECVRLDVKDVDVASRQILVRDGKGQKDRATTLPQTLLTPLRQHLARVKALDEQDLAEGFGEVYLSKAVRTTRGKIAHEVGLASGGHLHGPRSAPE